MARKFCSLLSGGKDSNYALYSALKKGWEPACVLVVRSRQEDSWMFHTPHTDLALLQLELMGLSSRARILEVSGIKEREVVELERGLETAMKDVGFDVITVGALASRYQYDRISGIAQRLGVDVYAPAWQAEPEEYMRRLEREGIRYVIVKISVMGLPRRLLGVPVVGRVLEEILVRARRYGFHPAFEGGEAETLVYYAPHYRARLCLRGERRSLGMYEHLLSLEWAGPERPGEPCIVVDGEAYE